MNGSCDSIFKSHEIFASIGGKRVKLRCLDCHLSRVMNAVHSLTERSRKWMQLNMWCNLRAVELSEKMKADQDLYKKRPRLVQKNECSRPRLNLIYSWAITQIIYLNIRDELLSCTIEINFRDRTFVFFYKKKIVTQNLFLINLTNEHFFLIIYF